MSQVLNSLFYSMSTLQMVVLCFALLRRIGKSAIMNRPHFFFMYNISTINSLCKSPKRGIDLHYVRSALTEI